MQIEISKIKPSPFQPRLEFDLEDLKGSILRDGILVPLTVRKSNEDYYELIDGERRLRLAKELGYEEVPCEVIDVDNETADRMVWKVNTLRKDYKPKEKALHYKRHQEEGMSLRGIAEVHEQDPHTIIAYLNVLKLNPSYQEKVWNGPLSISHVDVLESDFSNGVGIPTIESKLEIAEIRKLSVSEFRDMEKPVKAQSYERRVQAAQKEAEQIIPEPQIKIETPEDYEKAAEALKKEAKKKREEVMTEDERARAEIEKKRKAEESRKKQEEQKQKREERIAKKVVEEAKKLKKVELVKDKKFVEEVYEEHRSLEQKKLMKRLEGSRVKGKTGEPEVVIRIGVRRWIAELTGLAGKIRGYKFDNLYPEEIKGVLAAYGLIYIELKKFLDREEVYEYPKIGQK